MTLLEEIFKYSAWKDKRRREPPRDQKTEAVTTLDAGGKPSLVFCEFDEAKAHLALSILGKLPERIRGGRRIMWLWEENGHQFLKITRVGNENKEGVDY